MEYFVNTQVETIKKYKENPENNYMLTIARDGETPERSVYIFNNCLDAVNGYNSYTDWGFAKEYLTVSLYEPNGNVFTKILKRPPAGECVFVREQYYKIAKILLSIKGQLEEDSYAKLIKEIAKIFSMDNWRFDPVRFFIATECSREVTE